MTLLSPGVQVSVIDQSNYTPAAAGSIPYFLIATAQNKISGAGTGVAPGTLAANANKLYLMTSQRDLLSTYGVPFFYNTTAGTPINGYELNEYGLLAAYSALGVTNTAYVQRVDINLAALTATLTRPSGAPANGTYWLDTTNSTWGINQWNKTTSSFTNQVPLVITDTEYLETAATVPLQSYGSIGNYAVVAVTTTSTGSSNLTNPIYYKRSGPTTAQAPNWLQNGASADELYNTWTLVGSSEWETAWPTVQGTTVPGSLPVGNTIVINNQTITIAASPNNTVQYLAGQINSALNNDSVYASNNGGSLNLYADSGAVGANLVVTGASVANSVATLTFATQTTNVFAIGSVIRVTGVVSSGTGPSYNGNYTVVASGNSSVSYASTATGSYVSGGTVTQPRFISIQNGTGTPLTTLGITAGSYSCPAYYYGANYQAPRWRTTDNVPQPTGSIFQQTNSVNLGTTLLVRKYNSTLGTFVLQSCPVYVNNADAIYALDPANGGQSIPAGTTYAEIDPYNNDSAGFLIYERLTPGATVITGSNINPTFPTTIAVTGASGTGTTATLTFATQASNLFAIGSTITVAGLTGTGNVYNGTHTVAGCTLSSVSWASAAANAYVSGGTISGTGAYSTFTISATEPESSAYTTPVTAVITGSTSADFVSAVSAAGVPNVSATINSAGAIVFTHATGGDIIVDDGLHSPLSLAGFNTTCTGVTYVNLVNTSSGLQFSNWVTSPNFTYIPSNSPPDIDPASGTYWYYSDATVADIMIQNNGTWNGYQNVTNDVRGYNLSLTNATGPIFSATAPTTQTDSAESPLVYGDLWINTSDLENYPLISRWESVNDQDQWVLISTSDQTTINGILFADARWAPNGTTNPITDPLPPIFGPGGLITSDYLDLDAPDPLLYPEGMLLWNTRRGGFNVKTFEQNYFNATDYPYPAVLPTQTSTWLTASGNRANGSPYMGRQAQRAIIVKALRAGIDSNTQILENQIQFNLLACPQYPELAPNMVVANNNRGDTGFIVVDTPLRLSPSEIVTWATNNNGLGVVTGDGNLSAGQSYAAAFYPSCQTTDLSGNLVVTAPSHMMIRTIIRSDAVSYPWFAPAGLRRGLVDNAIQLGYIDAPTGEFTPTSINQGIRDVLYQNDVNPITFIPGAGITNFGNHTLQGTATALDRINVARLVCYLRGQLEVIGNQYLFEPNDTITRSAIAAQITSLMNALVSQRGIYDYLVVCDLSNNTPATIDANELFVDIAIEPVKAVEFIYIPMRIQNTGTIAAQGSA